MKIEVDASGFEAIEQALKENEKVAMIALRRAINKVAKQAQTGIIRYTGGELPLPHKKIRQHVALSKATTQNPQAVISIDYQPIPLFEYKPRQLKRGVSIRVNKQGTRSVLKHAFIAQSRSGKAGVFAREYGVARLPIRELYGPAIVEVAQNHLENVAKKAQEKLISVFEHEFEFAKGY